MLLTPEIVPGLVATGASARVEAAVAPRFRVGDPGRVRNLRPLTHTRLPGYLRSRVGTIEIDPYFFDRGDPLRVEDLLGANAIGAHGRGVHLDVLHVGTQAFSRGRLAAFQAPRPPPSDWAFS